MEGQTDTREKGRDTQGATIMYAAPTITNPPTKGLSTNIDAYRDSFLEMLKQGMTPLEAMGQFDREEWNAAMFAELDSKELFLNRETFLMETQDGKPSLLDLAARASRERMNLEDMNQAIELWLAGWTSESPSKHSDVMSWYWRRPPRRKGKPGRRYLSTDQAYNAMKKENANANQTH